MRGKVTTLTPVQSQASRSHAGIDTWEIYTPVVALDGWRLCRTLSGWIFWKRPYRKRPADLVHPTFRAIRSEKLVANSERLHIDLNHEKTLISIRTNTYTQMQTCLTDSTLPWMRGRIIVYEPTQADQAKD